MYAIVEIKGKQYKVEKDSIIDVDLIEDSISKKTISFSNVLALFDDKTTQFGTPFIENASIKAEVLEEIKDKKVIVFKFKRKTGYKKTQGHRQRYTRLKIMTIGSKKTKPEAKTDSKSPSSKTKSTADKATK